jgi:hypothetical protein
VGPIASLKETKEGAFFPVSLAKGGGLRFYKQIGRAYDRRLKEVEARLSPVSLAEGRGAADYAFTNETANLIWMLMSRH